MPDKISAETIENISILAKLSLTGSEKEKAVTDMEKMLTYMEKINDLDTDGIEPMQNVHASANVFREDIITNEDMSEALLALAPEKKDNYYNVPKTIE